MAPFAPRCSAASPAGLTSAYDGAGGDETCSGAVLAAPDLMRSALGTGLGLATGAFAMLLLDGRTRGRIVEVTRVMRRRPDAGGALEATVRAKLEHVTPHGRAVRPSVDHGCVVLTGDVLTEERALLVREVAAVEGVDSVVDLMQEHREPDGIPALVASGPSLATVPPIRAVARSTPRVLRACAVGTGVGLALTGLTLRGGPKTALGVAGGLLLAAGLAGAGGAGAVADVARIRRVVSLTAAVVVPAPAEEPFARFRSFEELPQILRHVRRVERRGPTRYRWTLASEGERPLAWDVELTELRINRRLTWKSVRGARVRMRGEARFERITDTSTRIVVHLSYALPFGRDGRAIRELLGRDPDVALADDLQRLAAGGSSSAPPPSRNARPSHGHA